MGVTIHYSLRLDTRSTAKAERTVRALHASITRFAARRGLGAPGPIRPLTAGAPHAERYVAVRGRQLEPRLLWVAPLEGWRFTVEIGEGCETATFGLARYPAFVTDGPRRRRTGFGGAWTFQSFCKTQYAGQLGPEHLLHCHRAVIDLILLWKKAGVEVTISDEGEYWPGRDPHVLLRRVKALDQFVAALAGALKDASEETGGPPVVSPIFEHPQFERLEAEGVAEHGPMIDQVRAALDELTPKPPGER